MKKGLIIFDLDGTITASAPGVINSVKYAIEKTGKEPLSEKELLSFVGPPMVYQFKLIYGIDDDEAMEMVRIFRERYNTQGVYESSLFPGIKELLEKLKTDGYMLSIATSKAAPTAKQVLEDFKMEKYFEHWHGAIGDNRRADKMDIIERVLKDCGYDNCRDKAFLVGDRKFDAQGSELCGIGFYGAGWGYAPEGELEAYPNLGIAASPEELYEMILAKDKEKDLDR